MVKLRTLINSYLFKERVNLELIDDFDLVLTKLNQFINFKKSKLYVVYLDGYTENKALKQKIEDIVVRKNLNFIDFKKEIIDKNISFQKLFPLSYPDTIMNMDTKF